MPIPPSSHALTAARSQPFISSSKRAFPVSSYTLIKRTFPFSSDLPKPVIMPGPKCTSSNVPAETCFAGKITGYFIFRVDKTPSGKDLFAFPQDPCLLLAPLLHTRPRLTQPS